MKSLLVTGLLLIGAATFCHTGFSATTGELLQRGLYAEEVEGNLEQAIEAYGQIIRNPSAPATHTAQALYRQGMCYLKLKDDASARAALEKLVTNYPGQTELVEKARPVLEELTDFDPAALMPADTLVYVEFGSPGKQVETVLSSLKGTPYENPLAVMANGPGMMRKGPGDILAALLNPSMMAEFKKIRSSAFGITGISADHPSMVCVLYPGRSDALRGLILAGLGMAGTPGESIDGMATVVLPHGPKEEPMKVAYDDRVVIAARPASQLEWCVKQYKRQISTPTLVSNNKSFSRLSKAQRENNVVTVWASVDDLYSRLIKFLPGGHLPPEIQKANAFADFEHIDEFVFTESIASNGFACRAEFQFKEGHQSMAYNMVRSTPLDRAAFQAVPADAIGVISVNLDQKAGMLAGMFLPMMGGETIPGVNSETVSDLKQITIFMMPRASADTNASAKSFPPNQLGLAITSRNPERTRNALASLLKSVAQETGHPSNETDRFFIGNDSNNGGPLYCHLEEVNGNILLSLNRGVLDASIAAIKNKRSISDSGPLHGAVSKLGSDDSKLILLNAGGMLSLSTPPRPGMSAEENAKWSANIDELVRALTGTTIQLHTEESSRRLALSCTLDGVPPLNRLFAPITQLAGMMNRGWGNRAMQSSPAATILPATKAPVIDGQPEEAWSAARKYALEHVSYNRPGSAADFSAEYRILSDANNLYLFVDVTDDVLKHGSPADRWYESDSIEIFIDADNAKGGEYGPNDCQFAFSWDKTSPSMQESKHDHTNGVKYVLATTDKGYRLEASFPWSTLGATPKIGGRMGIDVHVNDSDVSGQRDSKLMWHDSEDNAWEAPVQFGTAEFAGLIGWWKFDETDGKSAADSSGANHNGTLMGKAKWAKGKLGGAIELDGAGSFVRIADKSAFDLSGEATISCWVNLRSVPVEWTAILSKGDTAYRLSTVNEQRAFHFAVNDFTQFNDQIMVNGSTQVNANTWHHLVAVYDGTSVSLYLDGKLEQSRAWKGGIGQNDFDLLIGENGEMNRRCFDGLIDDVRLYNYALNESRIKTLAAGQ